MQTHAVISLYPNAAVPSAAATRKAYLKDHLHTLCTIVDLAVTALIGLGVLTCFGLVFTML